MTEPEDLEVLSDAFDRMGVWYRELAEEQTLRLASVFAGVALTEARPRRGLEEGAGGDVLFFDPKGAYLGKGSWGAEPPAFFPRGEEDGRLVPRREEKHPGS